MRTVGFFGGTFDPIHFGHISLALQLMEIHHLDKVLFCPAFCSPFKTSSPPIASPDARLAMLRLALAEIPQFEITPIEIEREGASYTIDTIRALQNDSIRFRLLLSEEAAARFSLWKEAAELIRLAPPLIGARGGSSPGQPLIQKGYTATRAIEISSTEVRERLRKGLYCGHLVPAKVLDYIRQRHLYSGG